MSLTRLYHFLPGDKLLEEHSGEEWRRWLAEDRGFSERTVNNRVSALNSFLQYLGKREWQSKNALISSGVTGIPSSLLSPVISSRLSHTQ